MSTTSPLAGIHIEEWRPDRAAADAIARDVASLGEILHAAVHDGAGVSFVVPFALEEACAFWTSRVVPGIAAGSKRVLVAREAGRIAGTVQLDLPWPPNQPHRADVGKMLVHPDARRRGIARALMLALEDLARADGRTLLTLDTVSDSPAEALYRSLGYVTIGVIPRFALKSLVRELEPATFMYKELGPARAA
jgi:GNAT superfamily N-acetyltransferase